MDEYERIVKAIRDGTFRGKILISGDSHGSHYVPEKEIQIILEKENVSFYLSTGDVCYKPKGLEGCSQPICFILNKMAFVSHRYLFFNPDDPERYMEKCPSELADAVRESKLFFLFHGHEHIQGVWQIPKDALIDRLRHIMIRENSTFKEGLYRINPGYVAGGEFAIIELADNMTVTFYRLTKVMLTLHFVM